MSLTIGIAGTAKNTGKTTTISALMEYLNEEKVTYAITSIGYDGEEIDNVTGLPKPRITVKQGSWAITAEKCLQVSTAKLKVVEHTKINTPLGEVLIGQVSEPGLLVISGPNNGRELKKINQCLESHGIEFILVDGALSRLSPMSITDGLIIATGAARHQEIDLLVKETSAIENIFSLPEFTLESIRTEIITAESVKLFRGESGTSEVRTYQCASLLSRDDLKDILISVKYGYKTIWIPGIISLPILQEIVQNPNSTGLNLILHDPTKLLVIGEPLEVVRWIEFAHEKAIGFYQYNPLELLCFTVNPFFPSYSAKQDLYEPAYINRDELVKKMRTSIKIPVIDVKNEGIGQIIKKIFCREVVLEGFRH